MTRHDPKRLNTEDRILWNRVARSTTPLEGKKLDPEPEPLKDLDMDAALGMEPPPAEGSVRPPASDNKRKGPSPLDRTTREKLSKGRVSIEARVDLHGLTQAEAHTLLLSFLHRAKARGMRHVLVITGKGSSGDGVLKRAVPAWFATAPFRGVVASHDHAARHHGGSGAIYVRLRKDGRSP